MSGYHIDGGHIDGGFDVLTDSVALTLNIAHTVVSRLRLH